MLMEGACLAELMARQVWWAGTPAMAAAATVALPLSPFPPWPWGALWIFTDIPA